MLDEEGFARLNAHLLRIDPLLETFCAETGFAVQTTGVGRYPRRRLHKGDDFMCFIEIHMDLDERGRRREEFFEDVPYSVGFGVWVDIGLTRYYRIFESAQHVPFSRLVDQLPSVLKEVRTALAEWNRERVIQEGRQTTLSAIEG